MRITSYSSSPAPFGALEWMISFFLMIPRATTFTRQLKAEALVEDDISCQVGNVVALGIIKKNEIIHSRAPKGAGRGVRCDLIGKPTDSSGLGGLPFASEALREEDELPTVGPSRT